MGFPIKPLPVPRTGDDSPASGVYRYVWLMSGRHQVWVCLLALAVAGLSMVPLELQRRIINDVIEGDAIDRLFVLGGIYLAIIAIEATGKFLLHVYQGWLSESAIRRTRDHLAEVQSARLEQDSEEVREGRAAAIINSEVDKLGGFVGEGISQPVVNLGMLVAIFGYMLVIEPLVALFALAFLIPQAAIVPWLQSRINRLIERRLGMLRDLSDRIVRRSAEPADESSERGLRQDLDRIYDNRMRIYVIKFVMKSSTNLLSAVAPLTVLMVGGYFVMSDQTTVGVVVAFISGFQRSSGPLRELLSYYRVAAQASVQHRMIAEWMR